MRKATTSSSEPVLLAGGNPQIAKADGDEPVQAYISAIPGWKRDVGRRLDELICNTAYFSDRGRSFQSDRGR